MEFTPPKRPRPLAKTPPVPVAPLWAPVRPGAMVILPDGTVNTGVPNPSLPPNLWNRPQTPSPVLRQFRGNMFLLETPPPIERRRQMSMTGTMAGSSMAGSSTDCPMPKTPSPTPKTKAKAKAKVPPIRFRPRMSKTKKSKTAKKAKAKKAAKAKH